MGIAQKKISVMLERRYAEIENRTDLSQYLWSACPAFVFYGFFVHIDYYTTFQYYLTLSATNSLNLS